MYRYMNYEICKMMYTWMYYTLKTKLIFMGVAYVNIHFVLGPIFVILLFSNKELIIIGGIHKRAQNVNIIFVK